MRFYCTSTDPIGGLNCEVLLYMYFNWSNRWSQSCSSTLRGIGPIGGLSCEVLLYFNWSNRWSKL